MKNLIIFHCLFVIIFVSCNDKKCNKEVLKLSEDSVMESPVCNKECMDSLLITAVTKGDTYAFNLAYMYFEEANRDNEILATSIIMANKYEYPFAYFCIYNTLMNQEYLNKEKLDKKTFNFALYNLAKSKELGYSDATAIYKAQFGGEDELKKSDYYLKKID